MKKAFTLAEVLAALAIVGVIAAVTVPTLQAGYLDRKYKSLAKKAHLTLQQAVDATILDDKIRKARAGMGTVYWLAVDSYTANGKTYTKEEPSLRILASSVYSKKSTIKLTDGMIIQDSNTLDVDLCASCATDRLCAIYVDVDGNSGPTGTTIGNSRPNLRAIDYSTDSNKATDIMVFQCRNNMVMPPPKTATTPAAHRTRIHLGIEEN